MRQISETNQGEGAGDIATQGDKSGRRSRRQVSQGDMPGRRSRRQGREISQGEGAGDTSVRETRQGDKAGRRSRRHVSQGDKSGRSSRRHGREISQGETRQGDKSGRQVSPLPPVCCTSDPLAFVRACVQQRQSACTSTQQWRLSAALKQTSGHRVQHSNRPAAGRKKTDQPQTRGPGPSLTS